MLCPFVGVGQCGTPTIKENIQFETAQDYRSQDSFASKCINWLLAHSEEECAQDWDLLNAFVLVWLSGHPDYLVDIKKESLPFLKEHPELLYSMLHGTARYVIDTPPDKRSSKAMHVQGLEAVADRARALKLHKESKVLKELCKQRRKESVGSWYDNQVN